jgi:hypothetical protein
MMGADSDGSINKEELMQHKPPCRGRQDRRSFDN